MSTQHILGKALTSARKRGMVRQEGLALVDMASLKYSRLDAHNCLQVRSVRVCACGAMCVFLCVSSTTACGCV